MSNLTPSMTFLLAVFCRMEKLDIAKISGQAKIGGTIVALGGATLMTLYKGITVLQLDDHHTNQQTVSEVHLDNKKLMKGAPFLLIQTLIAAGCYILQTKIVKKYPAPFTFSTLTSLAATIFSTILAAIVDHKASSWKLSWNISLVAPLYSGTIMSGIVSYIQTLVIQRKGPVFVTAFKPFTTVTVALMGPFILKEALHLGGILGAVLIILGLYAILWGKEDEKKKSQVQSATSDQVLDIREEK
ncbi:hypothetical protein JCGZ_24530 [Jatropha curcas]|uniref:WAT1-related protein n=2 Tax=Jatropha curcas TaxID=180498 RepID=A0A067KWE1_JATCU|nr:hypothetical protein JCGZ_24530 [Jatropha curcas]